MVESVKDQKICAVASGGKKKKKKKATVIRRQTTKKEKNDLIFIIEIKFDFKKVGAIKLSGGLTPCRGNSWSYGLTRAILPSVYVTFLATYPMKST